jgi:thiosulfate/3-mercaptopyruvate sulfurtransferase
MEKCNTCDRMISRRLLLGAALPLSAWAQTRPADPWPATKLMEPDELARILKDGGPQPVILSVVFPVLYRQRHIAHAIPAGPTSKPEGIAALRKAVAGRPKDANIVIYCGCCPMVVCPNIRPAYVLLRDSGFSNVRVLHLQTNLHTDWVEKGYPVASGVSSA